MDHVQLGPEQIRIVYRLIHEVCELGADAAAWRAHFQSRMLRLIDATIANSYVMSINLDPSALKRGVELLVETGTNAAWKEFLARGDITSNPENPAVMARFGTDFTCTRQELVDDASWYSSKFYERVCIPSDWDQHLLSQVCITPPGVVDVNAFARPQGCPPFGPREVAIVRLAHEELARLWRKPDPLGVNVLPLRLRQTLQCIRYGLSRKEIARQLGVSTHTAHLYERTLFARYSVAGRTELMALIASSISPALLPLKQDNDFFDNACLKET